MARPKRRSTIGKSNYIKGKKAKLEREQSLQTEQTEQEPINQPLESNVYDEQQVISDEDITDDEMDENELDFSETELVNIQTRLTNFVAWTPGADQKGRPTIYRKKDPRTIASHEKKRIEKAAGSRCIDEMFGQQKDIVKVATKTKKQQQVDDMKECAAALAKYADPRTKIDDLSFLQRVRLSTLHHFFPKVLDGVGKMEASEQLSRDMWQRKERFAQFIREWANEYLDTKTLTPSKRGIHAKIVSALRDEHLKEKCIHLFRSIKPEGRTVQRLKKFIENDLVIDEKEQLQRLL